MILGVHFFLSHKDIGNNESHALQKEMTLSSVNFEIQFGKKISSSHYVYYGKKQNLPQT